MFWQFFANSILAIRVDKHLLDQIDSSRHTIANYDPPFLPHKSSINSIDISELKETSSTMSPSQVNASINSNSNQDAGKLLLDACRSGDVGQIKQLVDNGAPLTSDWLGTSPLHLAAQNGHSDAADILLKAGASRDTRNKVDRTPLHFASIEGHLPIVTLLISNGAEIDAKDLLKMTPLHWSVERGHYDVVEYLLAHGADVNLHSKFDKTPIDIAYDNGHSDMIPLLEKHVHSSRPKSNQVIAIQSIKTRPTILPNKSNRNAKLVKTPNSNASLNDNSISSTNSNNKSFSMDAIKKMMNNSPTVKKEISASPNKITTRSSSIHNNTATLNMGNAKEALQWLEKNGYSSTAATSTTNGSKDSDSEPVGQQGTSTANKSKSNIITIAVNNRNFSQLIENSQSAPFVIINSSELDDKGKKVIKIDKVSSATKNHHNYSAVESSDVEEQTENDRLREELQSVKNENRQLKEEIKNLKIERTTLKRDLEKKEKLIDDYKKRFN